MLINDDTFAKLEGFLTFSHNDSNDSIIRLFTSLLDIVFIKCFNLFLYSGRDEMTDLRVITSFEMILLNIQIVCIKSFLSNVIVNNFSKISFLSSFE